MFWEAVKETDRTGASSNDKGAVCRAFGPFGWPRQISTVTQTAVHIAKACYAGKGRGPLIDSAALHMVTACATHLETIFPSWAR